MAISAKDVMSLRKKTGAGMMDCKKALTETDGDFDAAVKYLREKGVASAAKRADRDAKEGRIAVVINEDHTMGAIVEINSETDFVARNEEFISLVDKYASDALAIGQEKGINGKIGIDEFDISPLKELAGKIGENLGLRKAACIKADGCFIDNYIHPGDQLGVLIVLKGDKEALVSEATKTLSHDLTLQIAAASPQYVRKEEVASDEIEKEKEIYKTQMRNEGKPENILDRIAEGKINKFFEEVCLLNQPYVKEPKMSISDRIKEAGVEIDVDQFVRFKVGEGAA